MGIISSLLSPMEVTLASTPVSIGTPFNTNKGITSKDRVKREQLEEDYRFDPTIFNIINTCLQVSSHAGFKIKTKTSKWQVWYDKFFSEIGTIGEETTVSELVEYILQDMLMYGNSFVELIYDDETDSKVVDLHMLPEKKMDYVKTSTGEIITDKYGKSIGYTLTLPWGYESSTDGDKVPKQFEDLASVGTNQIFFLPHRVAHFKLFTYGERFYGIGLIEPAHLSSFRKRMIEEARANEIYTRGANTIIATVGNETHQATTQILSDTLKQIANFKHDRYFAFPDYVKIGTLPIDQNNAIDETLKYLTLAQATSAGIPFALANSSGEATNRQTLSNQQQILELRLEKIITKFTECFTKFILKRIAKTNEIPEIAEIKFGDIRVEEKNDKSKRIVEYAKINAIAPEELRDYIISTEDIEISEEKYQTWKKEKNKIEKPQDTKEKEPSEKDSNEKESKEQLNQKVKLSEKKTVELGGFYMPQITKVANVSNYSDKNLLDRHKILHVLFGKLEEGFAIEWTFEEIFIEHKKILEVLQDRKMEHIAPINWLDLINENFNKNEIHYIREGKNG